MSNIIWHQSLVEMVKFLDLEKITAKYSDEIHEAVMRVIDSGRYLQGIENECFESNYSEYIGSKYTIGVANGLDALLWIFRAYIEMGIMMPGDEIIVPANTYIASILAITENGLIPVLVEPKIDTYQIDDSKIERLITSKTKGILIVHLYGQCAYTDRIGEICRRKSLKLIEDNAQAHVLFSSSVQEESDNEYGHSKRKGRTLLEEWAQRNGASFTGMVLPNVFGPFGKPNYNSFVVTFCYKLTHGEIPQVLQDNEVKLIYIGNLCKHIIDKIKQVNNSDIPIVDKDIVPYDFDKKVTEVLSVLENFKNLYFNQGVIPELKNENDLNLFNTFRCYIDNRTYFPRKLMQQCDERGHFVETIKLGIGGQVSFSTTLPGVTRGNHFHTRKIERFTVIKGKARIQLRKIDTNDVLSFDLDGLEPSYIDMPIWYTHNIMNIGDEDLYTQFWISEWYNQEDADTYFEMV